MSVLHTKDEYGNSLEGRRTEHKLTQDTDNRVFFHTDCVSTVMPSYTFRNGEPFEEVCELQLKELDLNIFPRKSLL